MAGRTIGRCVRGAHRAAAAATLLLLLGATQGAGATDAGHAEQLTAGQAAAARSFDDTPIVSGNGYVVVEMLHDLLGASARALVGSLGARVLGHAGDGLLEIRIPAGRVSALERAAGSSRSGNR